MPSNDPDQALHAAVKAQDQLAQLVDAIRTHERHLRGQGLDARAFDHLLWRTADTVTGTDPRGNPA